MEDRQSTQVQDKVRRCNSLAKSSETSSYQRKRHNIPRIQESLFLFKCHDLRMHSRGRRHLANAVTHQSQSHTTDHVESGTIKPRRRMKGPIGSRPQSARRLYRERFTGRGGNRFRKKNHGRRMYYTIKESKSLVTRSSYIFVFKQ